MFPHEFFLGLKTGFEVKGTETLVRAVRACRALDEVRGLKLTAGVHRRRDHLRTAKSAEQVECLDCVLRRHIERGVQKTAVLVPDVEAVGEGLLEPAHGTLEHLGRADDQVKVKVCTRGQRPKLLPTEWICFLRASVSSWMELLRQWR